MAKLDCPIDPDVENTANAIHRCFSEAKRAATGKPWRPAKRQNNHEIWIKAAENCIMLGADPYSFVRAAFIYGEGTPPGGPFSTQLGTTAIVKWFNQYKRIHIGMDGSGDVFKEEIRQLLRDNQERMVAHWLRVRQIAGKTLLPRTNLDFLMDEAFTPLHTVPAYSRIIIGDAHPKLIEKFGMAARYQVKSNPRLAAVLLELGHNLDWAR